MFFLPLWCESNLVPPGIIVRLLLSKWIKPRCSLVKDYVAIPDHSRVQYTDIVLGTSIPRTSSPARQSNEEPAKLSRGGPASGETEFSLC
jgi:hypothetical protein